MKNSNQFLIFLASSLIIILLINFFVFELPTTTWVPKQPKSPSLEIPIKKSLVSLRFSEPIIEEKTLSTSLILNPENEKVAAIDIVISFDSKALVFVDSEPGELFEIPIILKKEINQEQGKLRFAMASQTPVQQQGVLVNLTFAIKDEHQGPIEIEVIKEESKISAIGKTGDVLGQSTKLLRFPISQ